MPCGENVTRRGLREFLCQFMVHSKVLKCNSLASPRVLTSKKELWKWNRARKTYKVLVSIVTGLVELTYQLVKQHLTPIQHSLQSLIKTIWYPNIFKFSYAATEHSCKHESVAIKAYKKVMKENHTNFQAKTYGTIIKNVPCYMLHLTLKVTSPCLK